MLAALGPFGRDSQHCATLGDACFGRALQLVLPEDDFDRCPIVGGAGRYLLTADLRIDNRGEVAATLGIASASLMQMSDSCLLLAAWEKWQLDCLGHLLGDVALAVWDLQSRCLTLARTPNSLRPLFFHQGADFVAFASTPQALVATDDVPTRLNHSKAAAIIARLPDSGSDTIFAGVELVRHGQVVRFVGGDKTNIHYWDIDNIPQCRLPDADLCEALRAELDRAVAAQLRRRKQVVACQLSSGRDSSAIATSAALAMRGTEGRLIALTGAPRAGFTGATSGGRIADESALAALTASSYPEMTHMICRSRTGSLVAALRGRAACHHRPITNPTALPWTQAIDETAARHGASVMLNGSTGNYSISSSGTGHLVDVMRDQGIGRWLRAAARIGRVSPRDWLSVGSVTWGPFVPEPFYRRLLRTGGRQMPDVPALELLRQPYREWAERQWTESFGDPRPPVSFAARRRDLLLRRDNGEKMSAAIYGLDLRDPTSDRRLVELCLSFSPDQLASRSWAPSPLYDQAFRDRLPPAVLYNRTRGVQGADWFEAFTSDDLLAAARGYARNRHVRELLDIPKIEQMIARWPNHSAPDAAYFVRCRDQLLPALAVADFIEFNFPDAGAQ